MLPVLLVGDSHLDNIDAAQLVRLEKAAGCAVANAAVGGADVHDLADQLARLRPAGIVVISIGTNDAAPWKRVPLPEFTAKLEETVVGLGNCLIIYVAPLGVDEARLTGVGDRLDAEVRRYAMAAMDIVRSHGGRVIDLAEELAAIRAQAFEPDGVHLTTVAYDVLLSLVANAIREIQPDALAGNQDHRIQHGPHVVLMCGVAGAGKTTYAEQLERAGFVRLSIDEELWLRHGSIDVSSPDWEALAADVRTDLRARLIALIEDGRRVVVDFSFWQRSTREDYKALIEKHGATWDVVYLQATPEVLSRRLLDRSLADGPNAVMVAPATLERYLAGFEEPCGEGETVIVQR